MFIRPLIPTLKMELQLSSSNGYQVSIQQCMVGLNLCQHHQLQHCQANESKDESSADEADFAELQAFLC